MNRAAKAQVRAGVFAAAITALATIPFAIHRGVTLREENRSLTEQLNAIVETRSVNESPMSAPTNHMADQAEKETAIVTSGNPPELLRLRAEISRLRREIDLMEDPAHLFSLSTNLQMQASRRAHELGWLLTEEEFRNGFPKETWVYSGYDTPKAAVKSLLFALSAGDADSILQSYTPEAMQRSMEYHWKGKTALEIAESARAAMATISSLQLQGQMREPRSTDKFRFFFSAKGSSATPLRTSIVVERVGNEWKCAGEGLSSILLAAPQTVQGVPVLPVR